MINIWYSNISGMDQKQITAGLHELPDEWRKDIIRYRFLKDQALRLAGKLMLYKAIVETGYLKDSFPFLQKGKNNKPFLKGWLPFNISHSGDVALLAFGGSSEIGIDIENIESDIDFVELSSFFTQEEQEFVRQKNDLSVFYDLWVRKEAILKAASIGIADGVNSFSVISDSFKYDSRDWYLQKIDIHEKYISYLATRFFCDRIVKKEFFFSS
jgi:4'-phosphopantetheinyl transferase